MSALKTHGSEILRYLLASGLVLGILGSSAEAVDLLDDGALVFSLGFTLVIHIAAVIGLLVRWKYSKWLAMATFLSDAFLAVTIAFALPEASTAAHQISAWYIAGASLIFATSAYFWRGDGDDE